MKTPVVFAAFLAIATAQIATPRYINVPVFPKHTADEWEEIFASQRVPTVTDWDTVADGVVEQPESSGLATPEERIVNGNDAKPGQVPWQAGLFLDNRFGCGGSLISEKVVLTAGHCVKGVKKFTVTLGIHWRNKTSEPTRVSRETTGVVIHEGYDRATIANDIAVLLFGEAFPITDRINTVALPTKSMETNPFEDHNATVSGFGRRDRSFNLSPVLRYVILPVMGNEECAKYFGKLVRSYNICGDGTGGRSACHGDSGGPFTVEEEGKVYVAGIVSFGSSQCDKGTPSVYTRVTSYLGWIQNKTGIIIKP